MQSAISHEELKEETKKDPELGELLKENRRGGKARRQARAHMEKYEKRSENTIKS